MPPVSTHRPPFPSPLVPAFSCAVLVAGVFGLLPELVATAIAVTVSAAVHGGSLLRGAWSAGRHPPSVRLGRAAGLLGIGVLATAGTLLASLIAGDRHCVVAIAGLFTATGLFLVALPRLPGTDGGIGWLVNTLEGLSLGAGGMFALWVLVLSREPVGGNTRILAVALLASCAIPVTLVSALSAARRYPTAMYCHAGALLCILGLADFALAADGVLAEVPSAAVFMIFGPVLMWHGVRRLAAGDAAAPRHERPLPAALRAAMLAAPVLAVIGATLVRLAQGGQLDGASLALGLALLVLLGFRESLARLRIRDQRAELNWLRARVGPVRPARIGSPRVDAVAVPHGPVSRRRLLVELRARLDGVLQNDALLVVEVAVGSWPAGLPSVAEVQLAVGTRGLAAPAGDGRFLVLVDGGPVPVTAVAARLLSSLDSSPETSDTGRVSIGIAEVCEASTPAGIVDRARLAQERAARQGTGVEWFDAELADAEARRRTVRQHLPHALERDEFVLLYRPIVDVQADRPVGAQVLVRWTSPTLGVVSPTEFLPVADETGEINALGAWILNGSCRQLSHWQDGEHPLWLLLRIVDRYLLETDMVGSIGAALRLHGLPPDQLVVETAESAVALDPVRACDQLAGVRALGARTCLAGAGTAGLALAQLRRLPIDVLKLAAAQNSDSDTGLALAAQVSRRYGVELLVDGVVTAEDLARVRAAGCRLAAGPVFGEPLTAERFEALIRDFRSPAAPVPAGDRPRRTTLAG